MTILQNLFVTKLSTLWNKLIKNIIGSLIIYDLPFEQHRKGGCSEFSNVSSKYLYPIQTNISNEEGKFLHFDQRLNYHDFKNINQLIIRTSN